MRFNDFLRLWGAPRSRPTQHASYISASRPSTSANHEGSPCFISIAAEFSGDSATHRDICPTKRLLAILLIASGEGV